jgi:hypothetical protein
MKVAFSFPYKQFKSNGKIVFGEQLKDGSTEARLLIGNLEHIFDTLIKENSLQFHLPSAYQISLIERELVEEFYVPKLNRKLRIEVADPKDEPAVKLFLAEEFLKQAPMFETLRK